jgi:hypothetical protein
MLEERYSFGHDNVVEIVISHETFNRSITIDGTQFLTTEDGVTFSEEERTVIINMLLEAQRQGLIDGGDYLEVIGLIAPSFPEVQVVEAEVWLGDTPELFELVVDGSLVPVFALQDNCG